jgi:hypothetical protein
MVLIIAAITALKRGCDQSARPGVKKDKVFRGGYEAAAVLGHRVELQINVLEKPIERIRETCAMMGIAEKFDHAPLELETFLEAEVAPG